MNEESGRLTNKELFRIRRDYGKLYARDFLDYYLSADELAHLIAELQVTHDVMVHTGQSQREIYLAEQEAALDASENGMKVMYPFDHPFGVYQRQPDDSIVYRSPKEARFQGVYVIGVEQMPGTVKIGCTADLYQRTRQLWHDIGKSFHIHRPHMESIAFIQTNRPNEIETMLHRKFAEYKVHGEWFQRAPVEIWLEQYRSASCV